MIMIKQISITDLRVVLFIEMTKPADLNMFKLGAYLKIFFELINLGSDFEGCYKNMMNLTSENGHRYIGQHFLFHKKMLSELCELFS